MTISTEAIIGIIAVVVASIPIGLVALKYWKLRSQQRQVDDSLHGYVLPRWHANTPDQGQSRTPPLPAQLIKEVRVSFHLR
ncbi:hypothetical protein BJX99DRAFT_93375 [Aspergillus californicus]